MLILIFSKKVGHSNVRFFVDLLLSRNFFCPRPFIVVGRFQQLIDPNIEAMTFVLNAAQGNK